ncbi:MAG TPA: AAA family ATPase, partial [Myxococcaceae bacterium]
MSLHEQIWSWAQQLKPWQSDLVRRLCASTTLTELEVDEVCRILLNAYDALEPGQTAPTPQAVQEKDLPQPAAVTGSTRILSLSSLENIGAIQPGQRLEFELRGLTVLYGDNGAGKSSYARVLKEACRASDRAIKILPNVYAPPVANHNVQGSAKIEIDESGTTRTIERIVNTGPTPELSSISVFDSGCAHSYSTTPNTLAYVPRSLTLFKRLADSQIRLAEIIQANIDKLLAARPQFEEVAVGTAARELIVSLTEKTSRERLIASATLSEQDTSQIQQLQSSLQLAASNNPAKAAGVLRRKAAEVKKLKLKLENMHASISHEHAAKLKEAQQGLLTAQAAAEVLLKDIQSSTGMPISTPAWKALWSAANEYCASLTAENASSVALAHSQACPLCLQPLADAAKDRFKNFQELAVGHLEKEVVNYRAALSERVQWLQSLPDPVDSANSAEHLLLSEVQELESAVSGFLSSFAVRRQAISQAYSNNLWTELPPLVEVPSSDLEKWIATTELKASELESLAQPEIRAQAEAQLKELKAKSKLNERLPDLLLLLENIKQVAKLKKALSALTTKSITTAQSKLMESVVTEDLRKLLKNEIEALRLAHLQVKMGSRGVTGKTVVDLQLNAPNGHKLSEVLSEGEQRALTLAFFLAEVGSGAHDGGIIFDDPVSSLDHERRELVAQRLAKEAAKRQVIV